MKVTLQLKDGNAEMTLQTALPGLDNEVLRNNILSALFKHREMFTIEIDTETFTAIVVPTGY